MSLTAEQYLDNMVRTYAYYQGTPTHVMREAGEAALLEAMDLEAQGAQAMADALPVSQGATHWAWSFDAFARRWMSERMAQAGAAYRAGAAA